MVHPEWTCLWCLICDVLVQLVQQSNIARFIAYRHALNMVGQALSHSVIKREFYWFFMVRSSDRPAIHLLMIWLLNGNTCTCKGGKVFVRVIRVCFLMSKLLSLSFFLFFWTEDLFSKGTLCIRKPVGNHKSHLFLKMAENLLRE